MTSPNQGDFAPEVRRGAWWSGDSRKAANGKATEVILEKRGLKDIPDLSEIEEVQMGKVMEPTIARLFQDKHRIELKDADYTLAHSKENWLKSHFDYISADGKTLVEVKNYSGSVINKFDEETNTIPKADMAQLIHEAACHNVSDIYLAVLFGGQRFRTFHFEITGEMKDELIKQMANYWGYCMSTNDPIPDSLEAAKIIFPTEDGQTITATEAVERACHTLKHYKEKITELQEQADQIDLAIRNFMGTKSTLFDIEGKTLVTWRNSKPSMKFDAKLFQQAMPDVYNKYIVEMAGSRRFLLK
jgi:predicted phage-related endonuclease